MNIPGIEKLKGLSTTEAKFFTFTSFKDYMDVPILPNQWLVRDILEKESLTVVFGAPESFKSFSAIDIALSIASGLPWHGNAVEQGPVFVIIGEGANGFRRRIAAWVESRRRAGEYIPPDMPFFVSETPAQFLDDDSARAVGDAINALRDAHGTPALIVIDTLARNFGPGDENSTQDMVSFISNLDEYVGRDFSRLIVHHSGLGDQTRSRGNSSLRAALDSEFCMRRDDNGGVILSCTKMKDAERFLPINFKPEIITLGGTDLDPITSIVLRHVFPEQKKIKLSIQMQQTLELIAALCVEKVSLSVDDCLRAIKDKKIYSRTAAYSALNKLEDKNLIIISDSYVSLSSLSSECLRGKQRHGTKTVFAVSPPLRGDSAKTSATKKKETNKIQRNPEWYGTAYCESPPPYSLRENRPPGMERESILLI